MHELTATSSNLAEDLLPAARRLHRTAVENFLAIHYRRICRIAYALCGEVSSARAAVKTVIRQSLRALPGWRNDTDATNWFLHHTVIKAREYGAAGVAASRDCLVQHMTDPSPQYIAFVRAFRNLPPQQREAFILFRGEHLEPRQAAVAMDCSTTAAANHLIAANKTLGAIAQEGFDAHAAALARVYASLTPPDDLVVANVGAAASRLMFRRAWTFAKRVAQAVILAALAWMIWRFWRMIVI